MERFHNQDTESFQNEDIELLKIDGLSWVSLVFILGSGIVVGGAIKLLIIW